MKNDIRAPLLPSSEGYQAMTQQFREKRPLCGFNFILDGFPETAHKPSYGFAGGRIPMAWLDFRNEDMSQLVEWSAVDALTARAIDGDRTRQRARFRGCGHVWVAGQNEVRSFIVGEGVISSRDGLAGDDRPCGWLPNLAWQCKENAHLEMPERESLRQHPTLEDRLGGGFWPVEHLEPSLRRHVIRMPEGRPDQLIVALVIREESKGLFTDREGSEFCLPLLASADDPQSWAHLEFFVELYACFYEKQVTPFIGLPYRAYPPIDHAFRTIEDLSGIKSAGDLPRGDAGGISFEEGEILANMERFVDEACLDRASGSDSTSETPVFEPTQDEYLQTSVDGRTELLSRLAPSNLDHWSASAESGQAFGQYLLAEHLLAGSAEGMAERKAVLWLRKAALQDFAPAQYTLGMRLLSENSHKAALEWLLKAADQNYAPAQLELGLFHIKQNDAGAGAMDDAEAVEWIHRAALQGYDVGQFWYAECLRHGKGLPADAAQANEWYRKAAEQGSEHAARRLGEL